MRSQAPQRSSFRPLSTPDLSNGPQAVATPQTRIDRFEAPQTDPFADLTHSQRMMANDRVRQGAVGVPAFLPTGERLTGWHLIDGTAARHGMADLAHAADIDIACLFAMTAPAYAAQLAARPRTPMFGNLHGAFAQRLPATEVRAQLEALVTDETLAVFMRSHPDPGPHRNFNEPRMDHAAQYWFWLQANGRGLSHPSLLLKLMADPMSAPSAPQRAHRDALKQCFVDVMMDQLDRGYQQPSSLQDSHYIERHLLAAAFEAPAVALFDVIFARARQQALATPISVADIQAALSKPTAQSLRRTLAEGLLAAEAVNTDSITGAITRQRRAPLPPWQQQLLTLLRDCPAWRRREVDDAIVTAMSTWLGGEADGGGQLDLTALQQHHGDDVVDVVLALHRGGDSHPIKDFRDHKSSPAARTLVDELRDVAQALTPVRNAMLVQREDAAERQDLLNHPVRSPFFNAPLSIAEQALLRDVPTLSTAVLAATIQRLPAAVGSLLPLVRTHDSNTLDMATESMVDVVGNASRASFLDDMAAAMDAKGGGTAATDQAVFGQALLEVLASLADDHGVISWTAIRDRYGPAAATWFARVEASQSQGMWGDIRAEQGLSHVPSGLSEATLTALGRGLPDVSLSSRMQALDQVSREFGGATALAGFEVVVAQHLFPTTMGLLDALHKNGLPKDKLHLIGKSYSTHERTYAAILGQGIDVDPSSRQDHQVAEDAAARLAAAARRQLDKLFSTVSAAELAAVPPKRRFLLFDEGGKMLEVLHKDFPQYAKLCIGVEHTDRGMQLLDELEKKGGKVLLPVVDMARSEAKKKFESPAIGESVVFHTELELEEMGLVPAKKEACIIGYGAVGKATADALRRRGHQVWVHDTDAAACQRARDDGCQVPDGNDEQRRRLALAHGHMTISCTGRTTLTPDDFATHLPSGAILVNAASGTHEFGIHALGDQQLAARTAAESLRSDGMAMTAFGGQQVATGPFMAPGKHRHLVFVGDHNGKPTEHVVLRGGAVVNMTRGMPPELVQLTLGLVLTSVLQAAANADGLKPGRIALDANHQQRLVALVEDDLRRQGLPSLSQPDFRAVARWG
jgi:S-adenosylhomocysteine hydrolase